MTRLPFRLVVALLFGLLLVACASRQTSTAIVVVAGPTRTARPALTATPSPGLFTAIHAQVTYVPTKMPRTPEPTKTRMLTPTITPTFVPTLTPATVAAGSEGYRLKEWTFPDAQVAIEEARGIVQLFDYQSRVSDYDVYDFDNYLRAMERETTHRFLLASQATNLLWQSAYDETEFIATNSQVEPFILALETNLNSSRITLSTLKAELNEHGFEAVTVYSATNLFGDERAAVVLHVTTFLMEGASAVLAIAGSQPGEYQVLSPHQHWLSLWHNSREVVVVDRNGNGQPEIQVIDNQYGTGFSIGYCNSQISLYEWQGPYPDGQFVNLTRQVGSAGVSASGECYADFWEFGPTTEGQSQSISSVNRLYVGADVWDYSRCSNYEQRTAYLWNGTTYQWDAETHSAPNPADENWCAVLWADWANSSDEKTTTIVSEALMAWPTKINELWGEASQDYFRFKLGTWYAMRGETNQALATLQTLRDNPTNPTFTTASQIAGDYLEIYQSKNSLVGACGAAYQTLRNNFEAQIETGFVASYWLSEFGLGTYPYNVCDLDTSFQQDIHSFTPQDIPSLIAWLREHQVVVWVVKQTDLNRDEREDWVALLKMPSSPIWKLWVLVQTDTGINAVIANSSFWPGESFSATLKSFVFSDNLPPIHVFNLNNSTSAFQIFEKQGVFHAVPVSTLGLPEELLPDLSEQERQEELVKLSEELLFRLKNVNGAIYTIEGLLTNNIIESTISNEPARIRPYLLYLLALAHELSGHEREAVQAYWQLWRDYPDSPYTFMARRKLVEVGP